MATHPELLNRVVVKDGTYWNLATFNLNQEHGKHATHVAGTIAATGLNSNAMGMAPDAVLWSNDAIGDFAEMAVQAAGAINGEIGISNHSYGVQLLDWTPTERDIFCGKYVAQSRQIDSITWFAPYYLPVFSAGNNGANNLTIDNYDLITSTKCAKNALTIGAVSPVNNYIDHTSVSHATFSNRGPTDDGRIKPDLCANGVGVYSSSPFDVSNPLGCPLLNCQYRFLDGTSMASPSVAGGLLLLQQHYKNKHGNFMRAASLKGLAIHTAKEAGDYDGPDYKFGWGLFDAKAAAILINEEYQNSEIRERVLLQNIEDTFTVYRDGNSLNQQFKATISWTDAPPAVMPSLNIDDTLPVLLNDLDMRIFDANFSSSSEQKPWRLGVNALNGSIVTQAVRDDNARDNIEKVESLLQTPGVYKIIVRHKGTLAGGHQNYSLIISGAHLIPDVCITPSGLSLLSITGTTATVQWTPTVNTTDYELRYKVLGGSGWTFINTPNNSATLTALQANKNYVVQVRANCLLGGYTSYSPMLVINTFQNQPQFDVLEYWFDDQYPATATLTASGSSTVLGGNGGLSLNVANLNPGLHHIYFRAKDNVGNWSSVISRSFLKGNAPVNKVRYWFDQNYSAHLETGLGNSVIPGMTFWLGGPLTNALNPGVHKLNSMFQTSAGLWSSSRSDLFIKLPPGNNMLIAYRYWFNQAYPSKIDGVINPAQPVIALTPSNLTINASGASNNVSDTFHIQFLNDRGQWSSVMSHEFTDYSTIYIDTKALIEGYYSASNNEMNPVLFNQGERLTLTNEADSVDVKLYEATAPYNLKFTFKGVVNQQGNLTCLFPGEALGNSYYLSVKGRNSIEVWTNQPELISLNTTYDFTTSATQAYGANQVEVSPGIFAFYTGDINQDGVVDGLDYNDWENDNNNFTAGYFSTDLNGDGIVDGFDFIFWEGNSNNFVGVVAP